MRQIDEKIVRTLYSQGTSVRQMAEKIGVARGTLTARLRQMGLEPRSSSEAGCIRHERLTTDERKSITAAANLVWKGRTAPVESLIAKAKSAESRQALSDLERQFVARFQDAGLEVRPLLTVFKYNIDIAIPDARLAIEIHGGNWHCSAKKWRQDTNKLSYLSRHGWFVSYLFTHDLQRGGNLEKLITLAKLSGRDPISPT